MPAEELAVFPDRETEEALIDLYLNTEHLHWDSERAKALESRPEDPLRDGGWERKDFLDATTGLAHLYIGHAELVRRCGEARRVALCVIVVFRTGCVFHRLPESTAVFLAENLRAWPTGEGSPSAADKIELYLVGETLEPIDLRKPR